MIMLPTRNEAERLLSDAERCNPGAWGNHSRVAAYCAEKIALSCSGMDADRAYVSGLLHDIGRKFGIRHLGHVSDGYTYMNSLGYEEVGRICLTHSFNNGRIEEYVGENDATEEEYQMIVSALEGIEFDDYDRLIQLCDALAGVSCVLDVEQRMQDVKNRYGFYPPEKWHKNIELLEYFKAKTGQDIYSLVDKGSFRILQ